MQNQNRGHATVPAPTHLMQSYQLVAKGHPETVVERHPDSHRAPPSHNQQPSPSFRMHQHQPYRNHSDLTMRLAAAAPATKQHAPPPPPTTAAATTAAATTAAATTAAATTAAAPAMHAASAQASQQTPTANRPVTNEQLLNELLGIGGRLTAVDHDVRKVLTKLEDMSQRMMNLEESVRVLQAAKSQSHEQRAVAAAASDRGGDTGERHAHVDPTPHLHPCLRVYGKCNYGSRCVFATYSRDSCLRHLKGRECAKQDCTESHAETPPDEVPQRGPTGCIR